MENLKIIIPMAGIGRRLVQLTHHRPKALVRIADKRLLDHVLNTFQVLENRYTLEYIFIIGYLGDQIREHMKAVHPEKKVSYYIQEQLLGQSHAVQLASDAISGPILLTYCDTINILDYSFLPLEKLDGVVSVKEVEDPRRHGVAVVGPGNLVTQLVEKPGTMDNKLVLTGLYCFAEGKELIKAIETQIRRDLSLNNEYYLADAINLLIQDGKHIRTQKVTQWLDAGTPEAMIETNAYMLGHQAEYQLERVAGGSNVFIDPVYIHESSYVENSIIGPNVSIGKNCKIIGSMIKDTVIDDESSITTILMENSLIGKGCSLQGKPVRLIVADNDKVVI